MRLIAISITVLLGLFWVAPALAQTAEDDRTFLTRMIEDTVSSDDLTVQLTGFAGALSSAATADSLTLADADGVWLRLDDLTITWNRSALLSGRVEIDAMQVERIELIRLPASSASESELPAAEATPFVLPELPVSVDIKSVTATEIILTEDLLGEPVTARFDGALTLAGGAGTADISLVRTDTKTGAFTVDAAYNNVSRQLSVFLLAEEGADGIAARMLGIPDRPALKLEVAGDAPLDGFEAAVALATDGTDRVTGTVGLTTPEGTTDQIFNVELSGDVRPLLEQQFHQFFGSVSVLRLSGTQRGAGGLRLDALTIAADQLVLRGRAAFDAQGWPEELHLRGRLGSGRGEPVQLPLSGAPVLVGGMALNVDYDTANGDAWTADFDISSLVRDGVEIDTLSLSGGGTLTPRGTGQRGRFIADLDYAAQGLVLDDPALSRAVGRDISGSLTLGRLSGEPFVIRGLTLNGAGLAATGRAYIKGPDDRFWTRVELAVEADDFSRFADLAGVDLAGEGTFDAFANIQPFDGIFDLRLGAQTTGLAIGNPQLDPLLTGRSALALRLARDTEGTQLERIVLYNDQVRISGSAQIGSARASGVFDAALQDLGVVLPALSGAANVTASVATNEQGVITLDAQASAPQANVTARGSATPVAAGGYRLDGTTNAAIADLTAYGQLVGQRLGGALETRLSGVFNTATGEATAEVTAQTQALRAGPPVLDPVLAGTGSIDANLRLSDAGRLRLDALNVAFPNLTVRGNLASSGADTTADLAVRLRDIGLLSSDFNGPVVADIRARQDIQGWQVSGDATGPVGTAATVSGRVGNTGALALAVRGSAPLALANVYIAPRQISGLARFDLAVNGPAALSSLRGPITISDARLSAPTLGQSLENVNGTVTLGGGTAQTDLRGNSTNGGDISLSGPIGMRAPFQAGLAIRLDDVVLRDPRLYRTTVSGTVRVTGPLQGGAAIAGRLDLGTTDVQVPSTGVSALGSLPQVTHLGAPTDVRRTLERAGLRPDGGDAGQSSRARSSAGPSYPIDLTIRAPSRIFIRGRGLDAELGGRLRLTGTTNNIQPLGRFDLVRGRLDILGQRFDLTEGFAQLQGDFTPFLRLVATTPTRTGTSVSIIVEGLADDIGVRFESVPQLPQDEVLSQLLFGRDLSEISPLQAVQLASAVATLAGGSGGGAINTLREGLDLDDLDFTTDDSGSAAVRAGKYLSDNVYTDVTISADGSAEINLNLDISSSVTARGSAASDGETSLGIFFERDY